MIINRKIVYFEIFLIVSLSVSFAYIAGSVHGEAITVEEILNFIFIIPSVSAQSSQCCVSASSGASCVDLPSDVCNDSCDGSCIPTSCAGVSSCSLGCGFDTSEGTCTPNTPKAHCDNDENCEFLEDPFCSHNTCDQGCCVIGLTANWRTRAECEVASARQGLSFTYDGNIEDEAACLATVETLIEGACTFNLGNDKDECRFTSQIECEGNFGGIFHKDMLCSNPSLNTVCEAEESVRCENDKVYYVDSCGNRENIYGTNSDGTVKDPSESCNPNSNNVNSGSCGNCNYNLGSVCGDYRPGTDKGNMEGLTCRDLNCYEDIEGNRFGTPKINGESWCEYDGTIGSGSLLGGGNAISGLLSNLPLQGEIGLLSTDLVGSRHFRELCINGQVEVEPCDDHRREVCVQNDETLENGQKIDTSICRTNMWEQCLGYNKEEGCEGTCFAQCGGNPDCRLQFVNVAKDFKYNLCVPKYPPGFDLSESGGIGGIAQSFIGDQIGDIGGGLGGIASQLTGQGGSGGGAEQVCSLGSNTCVVTFEKMCPGGWTCINNCECQDIGFTVQMNNLCVSLGDCGVYSNYQGKTTLLGASVKKDGSQGRAPPQPFILIPLYLVLTKILKPTPANGGFYKDENDILELPLGIIDPFIGGYNSVSGLDADIGVTGQLGNIFTGSSAPIAYGGVVAGAAAGGVLGGVAVGGTTASLVGANAGALGVTTVTTGAAPLLTPLAATGVGAAIVVVIVGTMYAIGCGSIEQVEINFECKPWQQPLAGYNCGSCHDDPSKPCTDYRCESIGNRCSLINPGTGVAECIKKDGDDGIPKITPWDGVLNTSLFRYEDVSNNGFRVRTKDGECIEAFTYLSFGVETDVHAQCYWALEPFEYDEKTGAQPTLEGNLFVKNHTMLTFLPSVESLLADEVSTPEELEEALAREVEDGITVQDYLFDKTGDWNIYLKCGNLDGVANDHEFRINFCVDPGPDKQDPVVVGTSPPPGNFTKIESTEQDAFFIVSEPSECRWDIINPNKPDKLESYNALANELTCETSVENSGCVNTVNNRLICGWVCSTTLPVTDVENDYFVQCRDQPWLGEDTERNVGSLFDYNLKRTETELVIDSIKPSGKIFSGSEPIIVNLEVETSGGAAGGNSLCEWSFDGELYVDRFKDSNGVKHRYTLNQMTAGDYELFVRCSDFVGNEVVDSTTFSLELDTTEPSVTRVFGNSGDVMVTTDEVARCFYNSSVSGCGFSSKNSKEFDGANSKLLSTDFLEGIDYNIFCEDVWGNRPDGCSIVVRRFDDV